MKTTMKELESKIDYVNKWCLKNKLTLEQINGKYVLCLYGGSKEIARGTRSDIWKILDVIEIIHYVENKDTK